ncbi:VOC family protein [Pseudomonadota bacterium]|uniref:VOC family protein n=1 Tax=unclassified Shewanella TaxID=196818 RepID=UPI0026E2217E|nr:VOC family protein [Shewanella sp. 4_MG-2023]MDO6677958.1 VOC family protein [Shewanella sp. 4_MG-2023]
MNYPYLIETWPEFSARIEAFISQLGLDKLSLECDHCALRVNDADKAKLLTEQFSEHGEVISNNMINGRPILIIKLTQPLTLADKNVTCVELPYPSDKNYPVEGWEHVELVMPSTAQTCEQLVTELVEKVPTLAPIIAGETAIKVKQSSPKGDNERLANPTIAFKAEGICVKVHPLGIEAIIASELN